MKKLLLFFSLLLSLLSLSLPAAAETFEKVTDFSTLNAGDQIIIVANHVKSGSNPYYNGFMLSSFSCSMSQSETAYGDIQDFDLTIDTPAALITLEDSGNTDYPWVMKLGEDKYIQSTATSSKNGIGSASSISDACKIKFQSGTANHEFNNSSASTRKYLRANITNGKTGATQITSGASNLGAKPEIYRLKASGPVDFKYALPASQELEEGDMFDLGLPEKRPSTITWTSDASDVAEIEDGIILAYKEGTANIKMTWEADANFNGSSEEGQTIVVKVNKHQLVEYNPAFNESINLVLGNTDKDYYEFPLGDKYPANINWSISDPTILEIADNLVTALKKGTAVVKATWDADDYFLAGEASTTVNVVEEIVAMFTPASVTASIDPAKGGSATAMFEAVGNEEIAIDNFNFSSSDESVATYDPATGIVTLKAVGSATITATLTEEAAKEYIFAEDVNPTLSVSVADINGPIGYELVTSLDQITDEDYYVVVANYDKDGTSYHKAMAITMGNDAFNSTDVTITNGLVNPTESTLILSAKKTAEGKYIWTTTNRESNGNLQGNNTHSNNNLQCGSTGSTYSDAATVSFTTNGELHMYFGAPTTVSKILLYGISQSAFKNYASSNATNSSYARPSLYRLNFVKAEAPDYEDFEGKGVGDQVKFTARHSSHKLQYREWTLAKTVSRAEPEIQYGEWKDAAGTTTHTHIIKDLEEVGDNLAAHGVEVRSVDSRGNVSSTVGFSYDGQKTVTGIESVAAEAEGEGVLYNLQGVRVNRATAAPGLYIERRGGKAVKVIL